MNSMTINEWLRVWRSDIKGIQTEIDYALDHLKKGEIEITIAKINGIKAKCREIVKSIDWMLNRG